jgi:hypothetical protein
MKQENRKKIEILVDAIVEFKNGEREIIEAINVRDTIIITGHMINDNEFMEGGGIPKENVKKIIGGYKKLVKVRFFNL